MVATKRVPLAEVDNGKERRCGTSEGVRPFQEPLGGFIFVCNNETMGEDFERHLFGLPQRYGESVKNIQPGLPLFLYNYSTHFLHGVFEASSDGGLNIEPEAWVENKDSRKNGRQSISRFPAQVRVRWREERPPLEEEKFRPLLFHYDGPRFRLQLSKSEAHELLKLFGASPVRKVDEVQEDAGGEWEKVKTKSKVSRAFRTTLAKGSTSPNSTTGRRWGPTVNGSGNGSSSNGGVPLSNFSNIMHEAVSRGRDRDNKADRWRTDSDSWSGSSSACTTSSSCGSHDEDRSKKVPQEDGCNADVSEAGCLVGGQSRVNGIASSNGFVLANCGSDTDRKVEVRLIEDDSNEVNGFTDSNSAEPSVCSSSYLRSGFVSYSAALKSGMLGIVAAENGFGETQLPTPSENVSSPKTSNGSRSSKSSYSSAAAVTGRSPISQNGTLKGEILEDRIDDGTTQKLEGRSNKVRSDGEGVISNHVKAAPLHPVENAKKELKVEHSVNGDGDSRKAEKVQAWGKPVSTRSNFQEIGTGQSTVGGHYHNKSPLKVAGDSSNSSKKVVKEGIKDIKKEGENGDGNSMHQHGNSELKESSIKPMEAVSRKNVWQGNDGAVLRLLHDPDPAVNSSPMTAGTIGQKVKSEACKKQEIGSSPSLQVTEVVVENPVDKGEFVPSLSPDGSQIQNLKQAPSSSGTLLPHGSHPKAPMRDPPLAQQARIPHEPRRQQFEHKHDKHQEERSHLRKQQGHTQDHLQHSSPMLHTQQHQGGQGPMPLRVSTPPPGIQQHNYPSLHSPATQLPLYRDRSRPRVPNVSIENVHGLAYRPVSRNMIDGEGPLHSPLVPGSWGLQSPVLLMPPMISPVAGNLSFPTPSPNLLVNAEALHSEILEFAQAARPSAETRVHAEAAVECVRSSVKQLWPEADVEVFGSFATGLCLHHSDVDVVVVDTPPPVESPETSALSGPRLLVSLIRALSSALKEYEWCGGLNTIETASMPVIKLRCNPLTDRPYDGPSVAIDITIGGKRSEYFAGVSQVSPQGKTSGMKAVNPKFEAARNAHNGAAAREFVIERLRQLPALAPLVLLLKAFLRHRGLNDVYSGGLGSFALTLMLVFYLERAPISCGNPPDIARPSKSPSSANFEANSLSVDTPQSSLVTAESVDLSDDDSSDSSVLTSTSASSIASLEIPSVQESSSGVQGICSAPDNVSTLGGLSNGEPLLRKAGGIVEELLESMHSVASPNLGTLLVGFLHFFGQEIDFSRVRLVLKGKNGSSGGVFWHEKNARTLPLWIDDPLRPDANIGAGSFNIWQVQAAMREMLSVITSPQSVSNDSLADGQRVGKGPGRRRQLPLLQQFLASDSIP